MTKQDRVPIDTQDEFSKKVVETMHVEQEGKEIIDVNGLKMTQETYDDWMNTTPEEDAYFASLALGLMQKDNDETL